MSVRTNQQVELVKVLVAKTKLNGMNNYHEVLVSMLLAPNYLLSRLIANANGEPEFIETWFKSITIDTVGPLPRGMRFSYLLKSELERLTGGLS
ncbi:hypothetical protein ACRZ5S_22815 (plasmid) [Vibrio scophthalmi]|uniref:hypothetical protein n=1 Tax=Vibrio scophthalmi TaxID=45658 RepID=UPI003EBF48B7